VPQQGEPAPKPSPKPQAPPAAAAPAKPERLRAAEPELAGTTTADDTASHQAAVEPSRPQTTRVVSADSLG
jgi:hypothetical protein